MILGQSWASASDASGNETFLRFLFNLAVPGMPPLAYHVSAFSWGSSGHIRQKHVKMVPVSALSRATIWQPSVMEMWHIWDMLLSNHLGFTWQSFPKIWQNPSSDKSLASLFKWKAEHLCWTWSWLLAKLHLFKQFVPHFKHVLDS